LKPLPQKPKKPKATPLALKDPDQVTISTTKAVAIVARDKRASTSYIQRRLQIGYNRAARLIELMEEQGVVSAPNHQGKREVLVGDH